MTSGEQSPGTKRGEKSAPPPQAKQPPKDPLQPPEGLSEEPRWIVRIHGADVGPLSSRELYPRLLVGEVDPDTMMMDQERFTKKRLKDISEFKPYLGLHNSQNPILLKERQMRERDEEWELKGKSRVKVYVAVAVAVVGLAVGGWRLILHQTGGSDFFLSAGDRVIGTGSMQVFNGKAGRRSAGRRRRKLRRRRRGRRARGGRRVARAGATAGSPTPGGKGGTAVTKMDLGSGGGAGVPIAAIRTSLGQHIRKIVPCLREKIRRTPGFGGRLTVRFTVKGTGRISDVRIEDTTYETSLLRKCIQQRSATWQLVRFSGVATVYYPFTIRRRTRW